MPAPLDVETAVTFLRGLPAQDRREAVAKIGEGEPGPIERRFLELAIVWKVSRGPSSSIQDLVLNPHYQQIIGLGPGVVPFILRELEHDADHWFWALRSITGADPIPPEHRGDLQRMSEDWLQWGREHGHLGPD